MLLLFAVAYAIVGAVEQGWADTRAGARATTVRARRAAAAKAEQVRRRGWRSPARWALAGGVGAGVVARGTWRITRGAGRSLGAGWRRGWEKGTARAVERRERRRGVRDDPGAPSWRHWITGRCPRCGHTARQTAAETDGCGCTDTDWSCPCALRNRRCEGVTEDVTAAPAGVGADAPRPSITDPGGGIIVTHVTTGEAATIEQTREGLSSMAAVATLHLDTAAAAQSEAAQLRTAAETMQANLAEVDIDPQTMADITVLLEAAHTLEAAAAELERAADATSAAAQRTLDGLNTRHGLVEEAVNATAHTARTDWYRH
ncbi:hypothetical protein [Pseudonocardia asaccharolytica]|uniref:Uncharacterized protein n=1 Tax=Pseudonocardia asaccharolytica DSM 44247 = NBRC 16224 TaxID=1123024 RepID=A0A511D3G6_9PSEU|nr:hypothetical protein [Pseudonocardia asaccharolytica]GEL19329.1 hypothetical protein PA7_31660 [Pseudonocardia asaccharolytica DSM 44247 = NBRC 16224]